MCVECLQWFAKAKQKDNVGGLTEGGWLSLFLCQKSKVKSDLRPSAKYNHTENN
jgi:hypothetical protein